MQDYYEPEHFLNRFYEALVIMEYGIYRRSPSLDLMDTADFVFAKDVDVVVEGPCSHLDLLNPQTIVFLGGIIKEKQVQLAKEDIKILMYPECCGSYDYYDLQELKKVFPGVTFLYADFKGYGHHAKINLEQLVKDLMNVDIIGMEDNNRAI